MQVHYKLSLLWNQFTKTKTHGNFSSQKTCKTYYQIHQQCDDNEIIDSPPFEMSLHNCYTKKSSTTITSNAHSVIFQSICSNLFVTYSIIYPRLLLNSSSIDNVFDQLL